MGYEYNIIQTSVQKVVEFAIEDRLSIAKFYKNYLKQFAYTISISLKLLVTCLHFNSVFFSAVKKFSTT